MISIEFVLLFLGFSIPLVCTPGPGNLIIAMTGASQGFKGALPLIAGIDLSYILFSLAFGAGLGRIFEIYPGIGPVLKIGGGLYLLYLSWKIWRSRPAAAGPAARPTGFIDGVILTVLNPKAHLLMILMFSQFLTPGHSGGFRILGLTAALALVNIPNHFAWALLGRWISGAVDRGETGRSNPVYAAMLAGVAVYMMMN